tara:strand:- start:1766 stop:1900 length:135 start_codon:yes stop_codon:yes gene_type:complete
MSEKDYTKDSTKWPETPGKPGWQVAKGKKKNGKKTKNIKIWDQA